MSPIASAIEARFNAVLEKIDLLLRAEHTEIPAPENAPKPKVFKRPKEVAEDEFVIEDNSGKKITLVAEQTLDATAIERAILRNVVHGEEFEDWFQSLRDSAAVSAILSRLKRVKDGNFGDHQKVRKGIYELRVDVGPGYRVYYGEALHLGKPTVLLLNGGNKKSQDKDIDRAVELLPEAISSLAMQETDEPVQKKKQYKDYDNEKAALTGSVKVHCRLVLAQARALLI